MSLALYVYIACCSPLLVWLIRGILEFQKRNLNSCIYFFKAFIFSSGLTIMGYGILDDIFLLIFYLSLLNLKSENSFFLKRQKPIYTLVFAALTIFLLLNSLRTVILLDDFRAIRFLFLFTLLFLLSINKKFAYFLYQNSEINKIISLIITPVAYLLSAYFLSEVLLYLVGFEKFQFQNIYWPSSSTMFSIIIFLFPLISFVCTKRIQSQLSKRNKRIIWYLFLLIFCNTFFYDSRLGQLFCVLIITIMLASNFMRGISVFIFLTLIIGVSYSGNILHFVDTLFTSAVGGQASDLDRIIQPIAAYMSVVENQSVLVNLFGYGYYAERIFVTDYIRSLYSEYGLDSFKATFIRMPSGPAFFAGNGIIGAMLFCSLLVAYSISLLKMPIVITLRLLIILFSSVLYVLSYFTSINYELVLFYLILAPNFMWFILSNSSTKKM